MGTDIEVITGGDVEEELRAATVARVTEIFHRHDRRFSRFRNDSELSALNARAGRWSRMSEEFGALLRFALRGARSTGGLFDPTVLSALVAAGYDRDFDEVHPMDGPVAPLHPAGAWGSLRVRGDRLRLPRGAGLDFGGVAKGWAVDEAARAGEHLPWVAINAGGDLRVTGAPPDGELLIGVEDPRSPGKEIGRIVLSQGAIATSSVTRRAWGPRHHHLIDPRTSLPADTGVVQTTVWAPTCSEAEIRSKWALLAGPPVIDRFPTVMVLDEGSVLRSIAGDEPGAPSG